MTYFLDCSVSVLLLWRDTTAMSTLMKESIQLELAYNFKSLVLSWWGTWLLADKLGAVEAAESSRSGAAGSSERKATLGLSWAFESSKFILGTHIHQQDHSSSDKAKSPKSTEIKCRSLMTKHSNVWVSVGHSNLNQPPPKIILLLHVCFYLNQCFLQYTSLNVWLIINN